MNYNIGSFDGLVNFYGDDITATNATITGTLTVQGLTVGKGNSSVLTNTALGIDALVDNTTGHNNTAIGYTSLEKNTSGFSNTSVGWSNLSSNTEGERNTGLGAYTLISNTTGNANTSIGNNGLINNSSGSNNTSIGYYCGESNLTGDNNTYLGTNSNCSGNVSNSTAIGFGAIVDLSNQIKIGTINETVEIDGNLTVQGLTVGKGGGNVATNTAFGIDCFKYKVSVGGGSTAVGYKSLFTDVSGQNNTAFGFYALNKSTGATQNTAVGGLSLQASTTGSYNSGCGLNSLYLNTTGSYNSGLGVNAGRNNKTGNYNTFLGYFTDMSGGTDFSNSTAIGAFTEVDASNQIRIGTANETTIIDGRFKVQGLTIGRGGTSGNDLMNNTAYGVDCLKITTGLEGGNCGFGYKSLTNDILGTDNCAFGQQSLLYNSDGLKNTAIGAYSGLYNISGSNNCFIGSHTNTNSSLNTFNYSTAIGSGSIISASNQIKIGTTNETTIIDGKLEVVKDCKFSGNITATGNGYTMIDSATSGSQVIEWIKSDTSGGIIGARVLIYASKYSDDFNIDLDSLNCANGFNISGIGIGYLLNLDMSGNMTVMNDITSNNILVNNKTPLPEQVGGYYTTSTSLSTGSGTATNNMTCGFWYYPPVGRFTMYITFIFTMPSTNITNFAFYFWNGTSNEIFRESFGATINYTAGSTVHKNYSFPIDITNTLNYLYPLTTFGGPASITIVEIKYKLVRIC